MNDSLLTVHLKATARQLVPIYLVLVLAMGLLCWFSGQKLTDIQEVLYFSVIFLVFACLTLLPQLVVMVRIYQCLYGPYAYLTQILPLSTGDLIRSFVGLSFVWNAITLPLMLIFGAVSLTLKPMTSFLEVDGADASQLGDLVSQGLVLWQKNPGPVTILLVGILIYIFFYLIAGGLLQLAWITLAQRLFSTRRIFTGLLVIAVVVQLAAIPLFFGLNSLFPPAMVIHILPGDILSIDPWMTAPYNVITGGADYLGDHPTAVFLLAWTHLLCLFLELFLAYLVAYRCLAKRPSLN
ncbi:hypothetical protein ACKQTC_01085 [Peptococcus simiae]|uniref:ABC-2 type transport system permease protein n=1 Tax=Peptococcus simiae TaxID=1643805 RepID=A0ABW9GXQ7_9FIRM